MKGRGKLGTKAMSVRGRNKPRKHAKGVNERKR